MKTALFYARTRLALRSELRARGHKFHEINDIIAGVDDEAIDVAVVEAQASAGVESATVGAIGDGAILKAITEFLKSDLGQALIKALLALLGL